MSLMPWWTTEQSGGYQSTFHLRSCSIDSSPSFAPNYEDMSRTLRMMADMTSKNGSFHVILDAIASERTWSACEDFTL